MGTKCSHGKALAILNSDNISDRDNTLVITADTMIIDNSGNKLGKPKNKEDALEMLLRHQSEKTHQVQTAVTLCYRNEFVEFLESTTVYLSQEIDETDLRDYIETGEPLDKAGAYCIQA